MESFIFCRSESFLIYKQPGAKSKLTTVRIVKTCVSLHNEK